MVVVVMEVIKTSVYIIIRRAAMNIAAVVVWIKH